MVGVRSAEMPYAYSVHPGLEARAQVCLRTIIGTTHRRSGMMSMDNTSGVGAEGGFDLWHLVTCRNFSLSECKPASTQEFRAQIVSRVFGSLGLSAASSRGISSIRMTRGRAQIRKDPRDHFMLYLVLNGQVDIEQDDRQASAFAGDMFLYDQTMPFSMNFYSNNRSVLVNIPRPLLAARLSGANHFTGRRIGGRFKAGRTCQLRHTSNCRVRRNIALRCRGAASTFDDGHRLDGA